MYCYLQVTCNLKAKCTTPLSQQYVRSDTYVWACKYTPKTESAQFKLQSICNVQAEKDQLTKQRLNTSVPFYWIRRPCFKKNTYKPPSLPPQIIQHIYTLYLTSSTNRRVEHINTPLHIEPICVNQETFPCIMLLFFIWLLSTYTLTVSKEST